MRQKSLLLSLLFGLSLSFCPWSFGSQPKEPQAGVAAEPKAGDDLQKKIVADVQANKVITLPDFGWLFRKLVPYLPPRAQEFFNNIRFSSPEIKIGIPGFKRGFGVSGTVTIYGVNVLGEVIVAWNEKGGEQISVMVGLPDGWKFSQTFPELSRLDAVDLSNLRFVLSSFEYKHPELILPENVPIKPGLNIVAGINLSGPLAYVKRFVDTMVAKKNRLGDAIVFEGGELIFTGVIAPNLMQSSFNTIIPLRIGLDFEKLYKAGKITSPPKLITRITTGELKLTMQADASFSIDTGIAIGLTTQKEEIGLRAFVEIGAEETKFGAYMPGMYDPAFGLKWLALGEFGAELDINYKALEITLAFGIPFTGIGFRGKLGIGEGADRATADLAAALQLGGRVSAVAGVGQPSQAAGEVVKAASSVMAEIGAVVFLAEVDQIKLSKLIQYLIKIAGKNIPLEKFPSITFSNLALSVVSKDTRLAGRIYQAGITIGGAMTLAGITGGAKLAIDPEVFSIAGTGYLSNIETPVFRLTGPGPDLQYDTEDDGPVVKLSFSPYLALATKEKEKGTYADQMGVFIVGAVEIPPLKIRQETEFLVTPELIYGKFGATIFDLIGVMVKLGFNLKNPEQFIAQVEFEQHFLDWLKANIRDELNQARENARKNLAKFSADAAAYEKALESAGFRMLQKVEKEIEALEQERDALKKECNSAKKVFQHPLRCGKIISLDLQIAERKLRKKAIQIDLKILVGSVDLLRQAAELEALQKAQDAILNATGTVLAGMASVVSAFNITAISTTVRGADLKQGRLPLVIITFGDGKKMAFQFDFRNPGNSAKQIALQLINFALSKR